MFTVLPMKLVFEWSCILLSDTSTVLMTPFWAYLALYILCRFGSILLILFYLSHRIFINVIYMLGIFHIFFHFDNIKYQPFRFLSKETGYTLLLCDSFWDVFFSVLWFAPFYWFLLPLFWLPQNDLFCLQHLSCASTRCDAIWKPLHISYCLSQSCTWAFVSPPERHQSSSFVGEIVSHAFSADSKN